jgi:hypothetical protein
VGEDGLDAQVRRGIPVIPDRRILIVTSGCNRVPGGMEMSLSKDSLSENPIISRPVNEILSGGGMYRGAEWAVPREAEKEKKQAAPQSRLSSPH